MMRSLNYGVQASVLFLLLCGAEWAWAEGVTGGGVSGLSDPKPDSVVGQFGIAGSRIHDQLVPLAIKTACAAVTLQWIFTYWKEIFNADLGNALAKAVGMLSWFGATILLINNADLMLNAQSGYLNLAASVVGITLADFSPGAIITNGIKVIGQTNLAVVAAMGYHPLELAQNLFGALMTVLADVFILVAFMVIALAVFVAQVEFWIVFAIAPLAFGLIPLSAFRDQGFAPIKGIISLGLRIIILGMIVAIANEMGNLLVSTLHDNSLQTLAGTLQLWGDSIFAPVFYFMAGMGGCAVMAFSAGKIASAIASGSSSFSGADAIKGGMQMATTTAAAAAGAGIAVGALKTATGATGNAFDAVRNLGGMGVKPSPSPGGGASGFGGPAMSRAPSLENKAPGTGGGDDAGATPAANDSMGPSGAPSGAVASAVTEAGGTLEAAQAAQKIADGGGSPAAVKRAAIDASPGDWSPQQMAAREKIGDAAASAVPPAPTGNASSAGIAGPGSGEGSNFKRIEELLANMQPKPPTAMQKLGDKTRVAAEQNAQDQHAVGVQMHVGKD